MRSIVLLAVATVLLAAGCARKDDSAEMGTPPADTAPQSMPEPTEPAPSPTPSETPPPPDATTPPPDQPTDPGTTTPPPPQ